MDDLCIPTGWGDMLLSELRSALDDETSCDHRDDEIEEGGL